MRITKEKLQESSCPCHPNLVACAYCLIRVQIIRNPQPPPKKKKSFPANWPMLSSASITRLQKISKGKPMQERVQIKKETSHGDREGERERERLWRRVRTLLQSTVGARMGKREEVARSLARALKVKRRGRGKTRINREDEGTTGWDVFLLFYCFQFCHPYFSNFYRNFIMYLLLAGKRLFIWIRYALR